MPLHPVIQRLIKTAYLRGHGDLPNKSLIDVREYYHKQFTLKLDAPYRKVRLEEEAEIRFHYPSDPQKTDLLPIVIYLRPSAYVLGSLDDTNYFCHFLAKHLQCVVAAIEPRLSPEVKFPLPFKDCVASIEYIYNHFKQFNIDLKKVAIWGESSGGNLAASLSYYFSKIDKTLIKCQILFYPMLDFFNDYPSKVAFDKGYLMDTSLRKWFVKQYLLDDSHIQDIRFSPLLAENFEDLPPTVLIGAEYDPMRDEAVCYIEKLIQYQVSAHALFLPGMIHGFLGYAMKLEAPQYAQIYAASMIRHHLKL